MIIYNLALDMIVVLVLIYRVIGE